MSWLNKFNPFSVPTAEQKAKKDLEDAKRHFLESMSQAEYHGKMAEYYRNLVNRLSMYEAHHAAQKESTHSTAH